jgi:tetratricopeptide (TPR) repeat protein
MRQLIYMVVTAAALGLATPVSGPAQELEGADEYGEAREAASLDSLFEDLGKERHPAGGRRIARQIWRIWADSGSATIDLLMEWSEKAIRDKKYATASDLLDQVTVLRPGFAEGYNRRATLNFLQDNYGESLADIERTLQLEPRHFGALSGLAEIMQRSEQDEQALRTWYRLLEIYPADERAQKAVIELEEKLSGQGI